MMDNIVILNFQEAKQPEYREKKGATGGYVEFGDKNDYPQYLLELYNKSAKHNAIIKGKVNYIIGNGWTVSQDDVIANEFIKHPNPYESLDDLTRKVSTDIEVFGGAYLEIIWSMVGGQLSSICHIDYTKIRTNKDNTQFWYKSNWQDRKEPAIIINKFNDKLRQGRQILYLKEYRPGLDTYALPGWMGALNYIESDIEVSRHVLGNAQTGFSASKMITLTNGDPTPDEKRNIERRFHDRFTGSDGKKIILSFTDDPTRKPIVDDLGTSDLTKENFGQVDLLIQQNLFAGHQIVSPVLFGIKTEGQLGGATELQNAYEIFKNTYANDKQRFIESSMNMLAKIKGATEDMHIIPLEPISFQLTEQTLVGLVPKEYLLEKAGIDLSRFNQVVEGEPTGESQKIVDGINALSPLVANKVLEYVTPNELRSLINLTPQQGGEGIANPTIGGALDPQQELASVNDSLRNMTGRQYQHLMRVVRQFSQGKITKEQATVMLKSGLGMSDQEINAMLGIDDDPETDDQVFSDQDIDSVISVFEQYGEMKQNFNVLSTRSVFSSHDTFADDYLVDSSADKKILELIKRDSLIPNDVIAQAIGRSLEFVQRRMQYLYDIEAIKINDITKQRTLTKPMNEIINKPLPTVIEVRYSYEWKPQFAIDSESKAATPLIQSSRPFCARLLRLDRFYTRREIEALSARLGYSVFDRGGGWWTKSSGYHSPSCRHEWRANVLVRKK
jgi:hypothetical protein